MFLDWDQILADWILAGKPDEMFAPKNVVWEHDKLHASDVVKCPRQTALRLRGEKEWRPPQDTIMLEAGTTRHWKLYSALRWKGIKFRYEVPIDMPEGWSGTADIILLEDEETCMDIKTQRAEAFKREARHSIWPQEHWVVQTDVYQIFRPSVKATGVIVSDRDGTNQSRTIAIPTITTERIEYVKERMDYLEWVRDHVDIELPPMLEYSMKWEKLTKTKDSWTGDLYYAPPWQCKVCGMQSCEMSKSSGVLLARKRVRTGLEITPAGEERLDDIEGALDEGWNALYM